MVRSSVRQSASCRRTTETKAGSLCDRTSAIMIFERRTPLCGPSAIARRGAVSAVANRIAAGLTRSLNQRVHRIGDLNFQLQTLDIVAQASSVFSPERLAPRYRRVVVERRRCAGEFPCWALAASASSRESWLWWLDRPWRMPNCSMTHCVIARARVRYPANVHWLHSKARARRSNRAARRTRRALR